MVQASRHNPFWGSRHQVAQPLRIDATLWPRAKDYVVVVAGDVDVSSLDHLMQVVRTGMTLDARTIVRLDGVNVFGSAASRAIGELLAEADLKDAEVLIQGVPSHVRAVFEIVGLHDDRISVQASAAAPLSPIMFDAVMAAGALRTREAVCITNADPEDPRIVFVNEAFTTLTGYHADEMLGASPRMLQGPLTDRKVLDRLKECLREGRDFSGEAVNYRADRSPFWMNWRVIGIGYGAHRYFMALQRDGTQMRQLSRHDAARNRMTHIVNSTNPPLQRSRILEALSSAVTTVLDPPEAIVTTAITGRSGDVVASNLEGNFTDPELLAGGQTNVFETDGSVSVHIPFEVGEDLDGHLLIQGIHPDWVRLLDIDQLSQLCEDSAHALANATS